jgi:glucose-1-phosphate adenylyltransferase
MYTNESTLTIKEAKYSGIPAKGSMIHDSCGLEGYAERSVIFGGTTIGRFAKIKDSVVMPHAQIGRNVLVECAIIGEGATIKDGAVIKGTPDQIVVIGPGETVVAKPAIRSQSSRLLKEVYDNGATLRAGGLSS